MSILLSPRARSASTSSWSSSILKREIAAEQRLLRDVPDEARLAARLNHPNVVQTNEVFVHDDLPVIVMEYLEGQPLSAILARARASKGCRGAMHSASSAKR